MRTFTIQPIAALALVGLLAGSAAAQGSKIGIAHVEDTTPSRGSFANPYIASLPDTGPVVNEMAPPAGPAVSSDYGPIEAPCEGGACAHGGECHDPHCCLHEFLMHGNANCLYGWLPGDGACTHSPDYGWTRPVKYPIRRVPVEYHRYWPTKWYGEPGTVQPYPTGRQFPVVFTPTDTTQLGYYYQRVPTWRPNPAMIPPPPFPTQWHHREYCEAIYAQQALAANAYQGATPTEIYTVPREQQAPTPMLEESPKPDNGQKDTDSAELLDPPLPAVRYSPYPRNAIRPVGY
jgi:hypothetical protein